VRSFFLLLLLANVAFFVWHDRVTDWISPRIAQEQRAPQADAEAPPIVLLSERRRDVAATQPAEQAGPETTPHVMATPRCVSAGPFTDRAMADQARAAAVEAGLNANLDQDERDVVVNYLLLMPERYATDEQAEAALQTLRAKGVQEAAAVPFGHQFAVSLGIYNRPRAMEKRRQEVLAAGFSPEVRERRARQTVYSVVVGYGEGENDRLADLQKTVAQLEPQVEWQEVACH
jgi:hypothetical protein